MKLRIEVLMDGGEVWNYKIFFNNIRYRTFNYYWAVKDELKNQFGIIAPSAKEVKKAKLWEVEV